MKMCDNLEDIKKVQCLIGIIMQLEKEVGDSERVIN